MNQKSSGRIQYTVVAVLREEALSTATETTFRVSVADGSGLCGVVLVAQPQDRAVPYRAGAVLCIDPRLVETNAAG